MNSNFAMEIKNFCLNTRLQRISSEKQNADTFSNDEIVWVSLEQEGNEKWPACETPQ